MNRAIFLDIDGTLTGTISGETFKQHSQDVLVLPGVEKALQYYQNQTPNWIMIGISNQGGVGAGYKSIEDAIAEMKYTLKLLPQLSAIYFCPDFAGQACWRIDRTVEFIVSEIDRIGNFDPMIREGNLIYRKPGAGMVFQAAKEFGIDLTQSWYVGDRSEDEQCAIAAGVQYMDATIWRNRFLPGMYEVKPATIEQVKFLESRNFSNDQN